MGSELIAESIRQMNQALRTFENALELILLDCENNIEDTMTTPDKEGRNHGTKEKKQNNNPL